MLINNNRVCAVRYYTDMYKCLYDRLKNACNASASAIYTTYHLTTQKRSLDTKNCTISQ